jgi:ABC-2 type transport system ATP-binding protein
MGLQLVSVTRRFGEQLALDSVSIHVRPGDCYGFIGHNGAGKTTAMRIALGLQRADSGRVIVDGFDART